MEKLLEQQLGDLKKSLFIYRIVLLILALALALTVQEFTLSSKPHKTVQTNAGKKDLPHYQEVMDVLKPLIYSAFPQLVKADTALSIDFDKKIWVLHHVHRFDDEGRLVLENGRYGLCGELAAYVYQSLMPVLKNQFELKFEKVDEAGYFLSP